MKLREAYRCATFEQQRWLNDFTREIEEVREEIVDLLAKRQLLIDMIEIKSKENPK